MSFAHPEFLFLLPIAAALVWWWKRRRRPAWRFSDTRLFAGLPSGRARLAGWGAALLRGLALVALVLAAAGPRTPDLLTRLPVEGVAVVLVLDVSGSMGTADFAGTGGSSPVSRLEAAKQSFELFVKGGAAPDGSRFEGRPNDQIGLVAFAAVPETVCPLTLDHGVLLQIVATQKPKESLDAGTNIGDAIAEGLARLDAAGERKKVLILLSDGEHNVHVERADQPLMPRQAANLAKALNVPVYAIDCGGEPNPLAPLEEQQQRADGRRVLEAVAEMTDGRAFAADSVEELHGVYRQIDALQRRPVESYFYRRYHEYDGWCALVAIAALALGTFLDRTWWRRVPT